MGASRETQDLFRLLKIKDYKRFWFWLKRYNKTTHEDTWMPIICKIKGHIPYQPEPKFEPEEWACKRCHRWINWSTNKEKKKKLNKKLKKIRKN